jgi:hypothetical protein
LIGKSKISLEISPPNAFDILVLPAGDRLIVASALPMREETKNLLRQAAEDPKTAEALLSGR